MKKQFENILFDLGNVIINIDLNLSIQAFADLVPHKRAELEKQFLQTEFFHDFERGALDNSSFRGGIRQILREDLSDQEIDQAWNALLLDIPEERREIIRGLQKKYRTFILSNTNDIHVQAIEAYLGEEVCLDDWFERVYYSHHMNLRKPDIAIYQQVLEDNQLDPKRTLFLDDNKANIESAASLGIESHLIIPGKREMSRFFQADGSDNYEIIL